MCLTHAHRFQAMFEIKTDYEVTVSGEIGHDQVIC